MRVADRKQHAALETVVIASALGRSGQNADRFQNFRAAGGFSGIARGAALADLLQNPIAIQRAEAQVEFFDALGRDSPFCEILPAGFGLGRLQQAVVILLFGPGHRLIERTLVELGGGSGGNAVIFVGHIARSVRRNAGLSSCGLGPFDGDAGPIGQHFQGLAELDAFHLHHEAEDVAADVADPALERLPLGIDLQRGLGVVVPGAEADVVAALAAQLDMAADQIDDVDRLLDPLFGVERQPPDTASSLWAIPANSISRSK